MKQDDIIIIINKGTPAEKTIHVDQRITNFGLPILHSDNYAQPYALPADVVSSHEALQFLCLFALRHAYNPASPKVRLPINTSNYKQVVDAVTYELCERYSNLLYAEEADHILTLAKWLQFRELEQAVAAAVAVNFYLGPGDKQIEDFMARNGIADVPHQSIEAIIEENKGLFDRIQQSTKEQFLKQSAVEPRQ